MSRLVVDSSVAIKWFVAEDDSEDALRLRNRHQLVAPDLLVAECVNAFWKKARRGELTAEEAVLACQSLARTGVVLQDMSELAATAGTMAIAFDHPAYDCFSWLSAPRNACRMLRRTSASSESCEPRTSSRQTS